MNRCSNPCHLRFWLSLNELISYENSSDAVLIAQLHWLLNFQHQKTHRMYSLLISHLIWAETCVAIVNRQELVKCRITSWINAQLCSRGRFHRKYKIFYKFVSFFCFFFCSLEGIDSTARLKFTAISNMIWRCFFFACLAVVFVGFFAPSSSSSSSPIFLLLFARQQHDPLWWWWRINKQHSVFCVFISFQFNLCMCVRASVYFIRLIFIFISLLIVLASTVILTMQKKTKHQQ